MTTRETRVKSFFRSRDTRYFEEDASRVSHPEQFKNFRNSFAISGGERGAVDFEAIGAVRIDYEGQLTIISSLSDDKFFHNFCSGPDVSVMNYPSALSQFRLNLATQESIQNAAFCLSISGYNFHSFLFEILPSLITFKEELHETDNLILGATKGGTFIKEFNDYLKIHKSIKLIPLRSSIVVNNAFGITSFPFRVYPIHILQEVQVRMREESRKFSSVKGSDICFIGRGDRDRNRRNLINEDAVLGEIENVFGECRVIRPGVTKLIETVSQIRDARVIIGLLGGSLAHLVWARSLELFIEIVPFNCYGVTETEELSKIYRFEYLRVNSVSVNSEDWTQAHQFCDINELHSLLKNQRFRYP